MITVPPISLGILTRLAKIGKGLFSGSKYWDRILDVQIKTPVTNLPILAHFTEEANVRVNIKSGYSTTGYTGGSYVTVEIDNVASDVAALVCSTIQNSKESAGLEIWAGYYGQMNFRMIFNGFLLNAISQRVGGGVTQGTTKLILYGNDIIDQNMAISKSYMGTTVYLILQDLCREMGYLPLFTNIDITLMKYIEFEYSIFDNVMTAFDKIVRKYKLLVLKEDARWIKVVATDVSLDIDIPAIINIGDGVVGMPVRSTNQVTFDTFFNQNLAVGKSFSFLKLGGAIDPTNLQYIPGIFIDVPGKFIKVSTEMFIASVWKVFTMEIDLETRGNAWYMRVTGTPWRLSMLEG